MASAEEVAMHLGLWEAAVLVEVETEAVAMVAAASEAAVTAMVGLATAGWAEEIPVAAMPAMEPEEVVG